MVDKQYCMSSFLQFRTIIDREKTFSERMVPRYAKISENREKIHNSEELYASLKRQVEAVTKKHKVALALSGGIDSAILAKFMPEGSTVYTFKCVVPGIAVTDETVIAKRYADECGLKQKIVEIYWEDFEKYAPLLMKHKGTPIHSIEVQIYKAALQAKEDGFECLLFGESSDVLYGGMSLLLSREWTIGEFTDRYSYVLPYHVLKNPQLVLEPYVEWQSDGMMDVHGFNSHVFYEEGLGSYINACETAGIKFCAPFSETIMDTKLDYERVRSGENKYFVREVFGKLYQNFEIPPKTPMPRPMNEWLAKWEGPKRDEFWRHCTDSMTGDQKWLVWVLEKFLDMLDEEENRE